jgi:hypothetical protein
LLLQLLILNGHVGQLSTEIAVGGGELFESGAVGSGGGSKFGGGRGKTLVIVSFDGGVGTVIESGVAGGGGHRIL